MDAQNRGDFELDIPINHNFHQKVGEKVLKWESTLPREYWEYRKRWEENPKNQVLEPFPIHLDIEATSSCNLKCVMCPRTELVNQGLFWKVQHFDFEVYKRLIDEGVENGLSSVKYNYLGEPLQQPRLIEMIEYAKEKGIIDVQFNTNAVLLRESISRRLIKSG